MVIVSFGFLYMECLAARTRSFKRSSIAWSICNMANFISMDVSLRRKCHNPCSRNSKADRSRGESFVVLFGGFFLLPSRAFGFAFGIAGLDYSLPDFSLDS